MLPNRASLASYGGAIRNYSAVIDPTTDEAAIYRNLYVNDTAMLTQTGARAIRSFVGVDGANPADPVTGLVHIAMWGSDPSVKPVIVRASEGVYDVTWPVAIDTELVSADVENGGGAQATIALNFARAFAQVESSDGTFKAASAKVTAANAVRVYTYAGTTLDDLPGLVITVWAW